MNFEWLASKNTKSWLQVVSILELDSKMSHICPTPISKGLLWKATEKGMGGYMGIDKKRMITNFQEEEITSCYPRENKQWLWKQLFTIIFFSRHGIFLAHTLFKFFSGFSMGSDMSICIGGKFINFSSGKLIFLTK